jgi:hypothetical protein
MARRIADTQFFFSGAAFAYLPLVEADFAAVSGTAYVPPERGNFRRIVAARTIQLLQDTPRLIHTYQTSAVTIRLPSNQIGTDETGNDAGNGRDIWINNKGTGTVTVADSLGNVLHTAQPNIKIICHSGNNQEWDIYLKSENIFFSALNFIATNVQDAIIELKNYILNKGRFSVTCGFDGTGSSGRWLEFVTNSPSGPSGSGVGFVVPSACILKEISFGCVSNSTTTVTIYKNFVAVATISSAAQRKKRVSVNVAYDELDEVSMQVTSGSSSKPLCNGFLYYT